MLRGLVAITLLGLPVADQPAVTVREHVRHQEIDGFGISQAFRRNELLKALPQAQQREVLDLWFDRDKGAGLSILRLGIGSSPAGSPYDHMVSIQPEDPGGPDAPPKYVWDGDDNSQVWVAKEAKAYGVKRFYADAWSAPGYMKDNGDDKNGGTLKPEWQRAYAKYLMQYTKFYAEEGIKITDLGFTNEPDWTATYASMRFTPEQARDFVKVLGPIAKGVKVACCDSFGWTESKAYTAAIEADPEARRWVKTHTGHTYASPVDGPLPTARKTWMSEWNPNGTTWNVNWDDGSGYDGFTIAQAVHDALTLGDVSAYVYWLGGSRGATRALLQIDDVARTYSVSKRLWALAAYSRFIRPGAVRLDAAAADPALKVSAFRNPDGSQVVEVLNTGTAPVTWRGVRGRATAYLTDEANSLTPSRVTGRTVTLQPRALTTIVMR
ncbi:glycoside hydrolase family 30 protein [Nonomuraea jiangxiensis]|uniref:Glucosylceramidase n=1 Tax=Nonomuraea jiangxiensis TaxID=633440 RepID=A0A1G7Z4H6_9ACTN|nr:glycoside hydrolase [Nonomuraea jiangxiensis]SDH03623.1 glucosylceramidase [Nonomuraea jiangxiensis]